MPREVSFGFYDAMGVAYVYQGCQIVGGMILRSDAPGYLAITRERGNPDAPPSAVAIYRPAVMDDFGTLVNVPDGLPL